MKKRLCAILSTMLLLLVGTQSARAHRPSFTQVERLVLPNGQAGELRLLKGDGILGPDPIRVLVLDADGRLVARSRRSALITASCKSATACKIFDLSDDTVLEPELSTFRSGPIVPGVQDHERDRLWEFEGGDDAWGFRARSASASERIEGNWAILEARWIGFALLTSLGALAGLAGFVGLRRPDAKSGGRTLVRIIEVCIRLLLVGFLFVLSLFLASLGGLTTELWLSALVTGAAAAFALVRIVEFVSSSLRRGLSVERQSQS
jgi:hypothetical protein